jgi:hypothetical protein
MVLSSSVRTASAQTKKIDNPQTTQRNQLGPSNHLRRSASVAQSNAGTVATKFEFQLAAGTKRLSRRILSLKYINACMPAASA